MKSQKINIEGLIEFLNDGLFTSILLKIYHKIPTSYSKDYLGYFLLNISALYIHDFVQSKFVGEMKLSTTNKKYLNSLRVNTLKLVGDVSSQHILKKINEMGMNFNKEINDCVITCRENELYDINFRCWYPYEDVEFKKFSYNLIHNCDLLLKGILLYKDVNIYNLIIDNLEENGIIDKYAEQVSLSKFEMYSYSSNIIYKNSRISDGEKIIIFQYYGLIKSIIYFESILNKKILTSNCGDISFSSDHFFIKLKALFIDSFYDSLREDTFLYNTIKEYTDNNIPNDFWLKNRKIRKNIHYNSFVKISDDDFKYVKKYQEMYLNRVIEIMNKQLNIVINSGVKINTFISKIVGELRKKTNN